MGCDREAAFPAALPPINDRQCGGRGGGEGGEESEEGGGRGKLYNLSQWFGTDAPLGLSHVTFFKHVCAPND